jgi:hypothetical protein
MFRERGESRFDSYQFRPHDGAGFLNTRRIYVDGGASWYTYHRRS